MAQQLNYSDTLKILSELILPPESFPVEINGLKDVLVEKESPSSEI